MSLFNRDLANVQVERIRGAAEATLASIDCALSARSSPLRSHPDLLLVYLDQKVWGELANDASARLPLERLVDGGEAVMPISMVHWLETSKAHRSIRDAILPLMARLSRGCFVVNPMMVMRLEGEAYRRRESREWIRSRLLRRSPLEAMVPGFATAIIARAGSALPIYRTEGFLRIWNDLLDAARNSAVVESVFQKGAAQLNASSTSLSGIRDTIAAVPGIDATMLPACDVVLADAFRSVAVRADLDAVIRARGAGQYEPNDIPDTAFLTSVLPYFDVAIVDKEMSQIARLVARRSPARVQARVHWKLAKLLSLVKPGTADA